jgi:hypothetical protein
MPDSDLTPTFPRVSVPPPEKQPEEELPTVPHSLAPLSGEGSDEAEPAQPGWSEVWRRRWLVVAAAVMAFLLALAIGRLNSSKHTDAPLPTLSGPSQPSNQDAPAIGAELEKTPPTAAPVEPQTPAGSEVAARETPGATPTPVATSDTLEMPAMEVPPGKGTAASGKARAHRSTAPSTDPAPHKRFMPGSI